MSGGALNYAYGHIDDLAEKIAVRANTPRQIAFARHMLLVAKAAHDLEWVWSDDYPMGAENAAIEAVLTPAAISKAATDIILDAVHAELARNTNFSSISRIADCEPQPGLPLTVDDQPLSKA
jgi:hypothetical protein